MKPSRASALFLPVILSFILALVSPAIASAQAGLTSFQSLANTAVNILNKGALLLIVATLVVYFYSIAGNLWKISRGEAGGDDLKRNLLWGIGVLFLMVSIWGILQILQDSLFGGPPPAASGSGGVIIYNQ